MATPDPAERPLRTRLLPVADEVTSPAPSWLASLPQGEPGLSRVAALGQTAQAAMRDGRAGVCLAALDEQRAAAGSEPPALVWALTVSSVCRATLGQLKRSRADLAEARQNCLYAAPLLAQPFWQFVEIVCNWLGGNWPAASSDASSLYAEQVAPMTPALFGVVLALRTELLRGLGHARESRVLAERLPSVAPPELTVWARAGLDADDGRGAEALRDLAEVCNDSGQSMYRGALALVLGRMATIAFGLGDRDAIQYAADALAGLDQAAPLTQTLTGLAQAYAAGDPEPARRAQQLAEAEGLATLTADALTVRGQLGDDPARTLASAHTAWERVGAPGRVAQVAAIMRAAGLPAPSPRLPAANVPATGPAVLTARERSVAVLVHEGRTNQQIAHVLNISVKTVEAYLTRLYRKTSCSSRVELAVAVTERRLIMGKGDAAGSP